MHLAGEPVLHDALAVYDCDRRYEFLKIDTTYVLEARERDQVRDQILQKCDAVTSSKKKAIGLCHFFRINYY